MYLEHIATHQSHSNLFERSTPAMIWEIPDDQLSCPINIEAKDGQVIFEFDPPCLVDVSTLLSETLSIFNPYPTIHPHSLSNMIIAYTPPTNEGQWYFDEQSQTQHYIITDPNNHGDITLTFPQHPDQPDSFLLSVPQSDGTYAQIAIKSNDLATLSKSHTTRPIGYKPSLLEHPNIQKLISIAEEHPYLKTLTAMITTLCAYIIISISNQSKMLDLFILLQNKTGVYLKPDAIPTQSQITQILSECANVMGFDANGAIKQTQENPIITQVFQVIGARLVIERYLLDLAIKWNQPLLAKYVFNKRIVPLLAKLVLLSQRR